MTMINQWDYITAGVNTLADTQVRMHWGCEEHPDRSCPHDKRPSRRTLPICNRKEPPRRLTFSRT